MKVTEESIGSLATWEIRFDLPVVFSANAEQAARQLERWVFYFARQYILCANSISTPKPGTKGTLAVFRFLYIARSLLKAFL
jgi:hypothetical protein